MPFWYLTHGDREGYNKINFKNNILKIIYVGKPVKTMEIRKTHVKNVQIETSAVYNDGCWTFQPIKGNLRILWIHLSVFPSACKPGSCPSYVRHVPL